MFILTNGKVELLPFKVTCVQTFNKMVKEGYIDEKTLKFVKPVIEKEDRELCCYFETADQAAKYAEEVDGKVMDLTPNAEIMSVLPSTTFTSVEEVKAFIENGVEPTPKVTLESLAEVVADIIGGVIDVG